MASTSIDTSPSLRSRGTIGCLVVARQVPAFSTMAFVLGWPVLVMRAAGFASSTVGYAFAYVGLLGSAVAVTWAGGGRRTVTRFQSRYLICRVACLDESVCVRRQKRDQTQLSKRHFTPAPRRDLT